MRKAQRVEYSTITVSLPREWVEDVKLKAGDIVLIKREDDGSLKLIRGMEREEEEVKNVKVKADLCNSPNLLARVITGSYVLGHDTIQILAEGELRKVHLGEIRTTVHRLTGLSIVEQNFKQVTLQNFIDPARFSIYGLMSRLHIIISSMLEASMKALVERRPELAVEASHMEEEADRIYWLILRQLLLAMRDRSTATKIGIESPLQIVGDSVVAKALEEMADSAENIANEASTLSDRDMSYGTILNEIAKFAGQVTEISEHIFKAFLTGEIKPANEAVEIADTAENNERKLTKRVLTYVKDANFAASLRIIISDLIQIAEYCRMIGEVTINRIIERPSQICYYYTPAPVSRRPFLLQSD